MTGSSYRSILRSSSITGVSQVVNVMSGVLRMKAVAVLLGPTGVGLAGTYLSLVQVASSVAALGVNDVGARQIAVARATGGDGAVGHVRRALFWATIALSVAGAALFWLASGRIARSVFGDATRTHEVAWLSLAIAFTVVARSQAALLVGFRRIGDLARVNVGASVLSAALGVTAVWLWGSAGLIFMIVLSQAAMCLFGLHFVAKLDSSTRTASSFTQMRREWKTIFGLGLAFMMSSLVWMIGELTVRALVQRSLGVESLGQFQAAWSIGMTYVGFILGAMGTDYYPRLTSAIDDHVSATRLVNEQTEVALLLCAPVLVALLGGAPYVVRLLYSTQFASSVDILRWQLLGDILKVMSWPLGYVLLASGAGKTALATQALGSATFVLGVLVGLPFIGVTATGAAFLGTYTVYLLLVWREGRRLIKFRWTREVLLQAAKLATSAILVGVAGHWSDALGAKLGIALGAALGVSGLLRLIKLIKVRGKLGGLVEAGERVRKWMLRRA